VLPLLRSIGTVAGGGHALGGEINRYRIVVGISRPEG
jgi:hypothetical protein